MRGIRAPVIVLALLVFLSGCMGRQTVVLRGDQDLIRPTGPKDILVKHCRSSSMEVRIFLNSPVHSSEEMWTRRSARIEITTYQVEEYGIFPPLVVVWDHVLEPNTSRTFADFPTFFDGDVFSHRLKFTEKKYRDTFKKFLRHLAANQSLTHEALTGIMTPYNTLIEDCLY